MTVTFCGHSDFSFKDSDKEKLKDLLIKLVVKFPTCKFYLGGYGNFDALCFSTLKEIKKDFPNIELIFITPYLNNNYGKLNLAKNQYDNIIFPPLENSLPKFAISKRNEWMVDNSDLLIAFVHHGFGGASKTLDYAKRKKVNYYNLAL